MHEGVREIIVPAEFPALSEYKIVCHKNYPINFEWKLPETVAKIAPL